VKAIFKPRQNIDSDDIRKPNRDVGSQASGGNE